MTRAAAVEPDAPTGTDRLVLDTNVCLDLFVFADPGVAPLRRALEAGTVRAVCDAACREEFVRVLAYPAMALPIGVQRAGLDVFDALVRPCDAAKPAIEAPPLPRCRDPDDQKFLELARRAGATWLLTRDDALLRLSRRTQREFGFAIVRPSAWTAPPDRTA